MLGKEGKSGLVIRTHAPTRRIILLATIALISLFTLYVVYELGRYNAGYDRLAVQQERTEQEVAMEHLEKTNRELRTQLAELDTFRVGRAREQAEVARSIGDLQAQVARQSQELAFYRGVVAQGASELGVKIGTVRIAAGQKPGQFVVHLSLVRSGRPESVVTGVLGLTVDGESGGKTVTTLDLAALTSGKQRELPFNFRFYENFDQEITIPADFKPEHLAVEVRSNRKDVSPLVQTFLWSLEASP
jgi:hypothetical protein